MTWKQPYSGRIILSLVFACGIPDQWRVGPRCRADLQAQSCQRMSAVVFVFGLCALVTAVVQFCTC